MQQSLVLFHSLSSLSKSRNCAFDTVEDDVLDLQLVLVVGVVLRQVAELLKKKWLKKMVFNNWKFNLGQMQTVVCQLGGDKVLCNLDAVVKIPHLMAGTARDEHCVSLALDDCVAFHAVFSVETHPEAGIQVGALVMNWVIVWV